MTYNGSCLCGTIHWEYSGEITGVTSCNCSACRRYGALWAYGYVDEEIKVSGAKTNFYARGNKNLEFHFCPSCSCIIAWRGTKLNEHGQSRIAVNTRLINDYKLIANIPIDHFDGFDTFEDLPRDSRCVKDMWF